MPRREAGSAWLSKYQPHVAAQVFHKHRQVNIYVYLVIQLSSFAVSQLQEVELNDFLHCSSVKQASQQLRHQLAASALHTGVSMIDGEQCVNLTMKPQEVLVIAPKKPQFHDYQLAAYVGTPTAASSIAFRRYKSTAHVVHGA